MKKFKRFVLFGIITFCLLASVTGCSSKKVDDQTESYNDEYVRPKSELGKMLPIPDSRTGTLVSDDESGFCLEITNISNDNFKKYVDTCWDAGYTEDYSRTDSSFCGSNSDGYNVSIFENSTNKSMVISFNAPVIETE